MLVTWGVYKWIDKYVSLMQKYLDIKPDVSNVWSTDELYLKVKGDKKYLFALMDDETRFWIAQQISDKKNTNDVRPLFKKRIEAAGKESLLFSLVMVHLIFVMLIRGNFLPGKPQEPNILGILDMR